MKWFHDILKMNNKIINFNFYCIHSVILLLHFIFTNYYSFIHSYMIIYTFIHDHLNIHTWLFIHSYMIIYKFLCLILSLVISICFKVLVLSLIVFFAWKAYVLKKKVCYIQLCFSTINIFHFSFCARKVSGVRLISVIVKHCKQKTYGTYKR